MYKASHEPGGPRRCSGDGRGTLERSTGKVSALEWVQAAIAREADASAFEPVTSPAGHTLTVQKARWRGVRTHTGALRGM
ncbi:MAG: hypothetical protein AB7G47_14300 [Mycolicibacterium sp.]|uniref:hypothetical protein n=1 Tax=Mycolicibacterium sp. TaxID=2320850 RepID=UPI003D10E9B2